MSNIGESKVYNKIYNRDDVLLWDVIEFQDNTTLKVNIISTNSKYKQGIRIAVDFGDGLIDINGLTGKEFYLMEDTCPKDAIVKVSSKRGKLSVYNVYERTDGNLRSLGDYSGMIVKENGKYREYRCTTSSIDDFNTLVFSIEIT
ncbi:hypothetical protein [Pseudobutyrivibrio sp. MD2005]|uniref:hypothetical protein n=1 Tax=Pseudobutyrivibrio sp. MD2005 TaxID=1410616 RepID=UPI00048A160E|nr:hypothetical protein [Pseudobutyrivibrio sp. MD2005]